MAHPELQGRTGGEGTMHGISRPAFGWLSDSPPPRKPRGDAPEGMHTYAFIAQPLAAIDCSPAGLGVVAAFCGKRTLLVVDCASLIWVKILCSILIANPFKQQLM